MQSTWTFLRFLLMALTRNTSVREKPRPATDADIVMLCNAANSASLPDVSAKQLKKLKQLTIVSLAKQSKVVSYKVLQENLDISNLRELEDLVIESIYAGLLRGKLDQRAEHLEVKYAISRDIKDEDLDEMMQKLTDW
jgi:hypothetical protein